MAKFFDQIEKVIFNLIKHKHTTSVKTKYNLKS